MPAPAEKLAVKCGEKPGFRLGSVAQITPFLRPDIECLLRKVCGVAVVSGEAESKSVERRIVRIHELFKVHSRHIGKRFRGRHYSFVVITPALPADSALAAKIDEANCQLPGNKAAC